MNARLIRQMALLSLGLFTAVDAVGASAITVTSMGGSTSFVTGGSGTANFSVKVDSDIQPKNIPLQLYFMDKNGGRYASQLTSGASTCTGVPTVCGNPISLKAGEQCCLKLALDGGQLPPKTYILKAFVGTKPDVPNSIYNGQASDLPITVTSQPLTTTLSISKTELALSVNNPGLNAALTGNSRILTIQNTGSQTATGLAISYPTWPGGTPATTASSTCGTTLASNDTCFITITPGSIATSTCNTGIAPTPGIITIGANNAIAVQSAVVVLSYGCIEQAGFIYSIDDTTNNGLTGTCASPPCAGSIGGKTAMLKDTVQGQTTPFFGDPSWGGSGTDVGTSTYETSSLGANNGSANTTTITGALNCTASTSPQYAACLCSTLSVDASGNTCASGTCYTSWYLPAICELAPFTGGAACIGTNIQQQLFEATPAVSGLGLVNTGYYWSSTEFSGYPQLIAWYEFFSTGGSLQDNDFKYYVLGVRCSRALTL